MISKNPKIIMTSSEFVERAKTLAGRRTFYRNKWPYNLCYNHSNGKTSADCVNLYKTILNGYDVNNTKTGYYQHDLSNTGDCTEAELLAQCSDVSSAFSSLTEGIPEILYMKGHIGAYMGQEMLIDGHLYNVIECTSNWGGGIIYSYVDTSGRRLRYRNGEQRGIWTHHGKMTKWVDYQGTGEIPAQNPAKKTNQEIAWEVIDGKWGNGAERKRRLTQAGYDYMEIQSLVNAVLVPAKKEVWHTVKSGEVASGIAKKYGVTLESLKALNPSVKNWDLIFPNQRLRIK